MSNHAIAASESFVDDSGKEWVMSPIQIPDIKELETYAKQQIIREGQALLEGLPSEERRYLLDKVWAEAKATQFGTHAFGERMESLSGVTHLVYLSLRHRHSDVTKAKVEQLITFQNVAEFTKRVARVMGVDAENPTKAGETPPAATNP